MPHNVVCKKENLKLMKENPCPPMPLQRCCYNSRDWRLSLSLLANAGACATASAPRFGRVWEQIRSRLGADSVASAPRFGRRWEQIRMPLLPDSPKVIVLEMVGFLWDRKSPAAMRFAWRQGWFGFGRVVAWFSNGERISWAILPLLIPRIAEWTPPHWW